MKNFIYLIACLLSYSTFANAQMKVDSIGRSYLGERPEEIFEKIVGATATIYGKGESTLNLYSDSPTIADFEDRGAPYFIQCAYGNTNKIEGGIIGIGEREYHRVFYVNSNGVVYAKGGTIQPAVDPSSIGVTTRSQSALQTSALDKLVGIKGVSYTEESNIGQQARMSDIGGSISGNKRLGLLAEDVESAVPEAVVTLSDNSKCISYSDLVVVLIDAVNELNQEVLNLKEELNSSQALVKTTKSTTQVNSLYSDKTFMSQNTPNPFNKETVISYSLDYTISDAFICIYDMQGKQIRRYDLHDRQGEIIIAASEFDAGMYIYSLIADGVEVECYKMILTK